jgi:hypothetical protein
MREVKLRYVHAKRIALAKLEAELRDPLAKCNFQLRHPPGKQNGRFPVLTVHTRGCCMKIEVLYVPNCPNHAVGLERLREILAGKSFEAHLNEVLVSSAAMAQSIRFPGSPTIRINVRNIESKSERPQLSGRQVEASC